MGTQQFPIFPRELSQEKLGHREWELLGFVGVGRVRNWDQQKDNSSSAGIWRGVHGNIWGWGAPSGGSLSGHAREKRLSQLC